MMPRDECEKQLAAEVADLKKAAGMGRDGDGGVGGGGGGGGNFLMDGKMGQELDKLMKRQGNLLSCASPDLQRQRRRC